MTAEHAVLDAAAEAALRLAAERPWREVTLRDIAAAAAVMIRGVLGRKSPASATRSPGRMAAAFTRGLQRHVMACMKHFALNSMENARFSVDVTVDERSLHEVYLPHFRAAVEAGAMSVMSAYNSVNGAWKLCSTGPPSCRPTTPNWRRRCAGW